MATGFQRCANHLLGGDRLNPRAEQLLKLIRCRAPSISSDIAERSDSGPFAALAHFKSKVPTAIAPLHRPVPGLSAPPVFDP
jgi:hypothetical protein